jgi:glycerol-3-phosphate dehydrogenase
MAEDTIDQAATLGGLDDRPSVSAELRIHGHHRNAEIFGDLRAYGSDAPDLQGMIREDDRLGERLHPDRPTVAAQVVWAARNEMARTVEDVLSRRTRELLLDARASLDMAPKVAALLAEELGHDSDWERQQAESYRDLARGYLIGDGAGHLPTPDTA